MNDRAKTEQEKRQALEKALESIETSIGQMSASNELLPHLKQQQAQLSEQLQRLSATTVGTGEYARTQESIAKILNDIVTTVSSMSPAMTSMQATMRDLAVMYQATLEVADHPVQLSERSAQSISGGLSKQLMMSLSSEISPSVEKAYAQVQHEIKRHYERAVAELEREREKMAKETERRSRLLDEEKALLERKESLSQQSQRFTLWSITAVVAATMGLVAIGALGHGLLTLVGVDVGIRQMWERTWDASTWYGGVGWFLLSVGVVSVVIGSAGFAGAKMWEAIDSDEGHR